VVLRAHGPSPLNSIQAEPIHGRMLAAFLTSLAATLALACALAGPARAADQFTLDRQAESIGPVVVDESGNGYVAWLHKTGATATVMFCKLAPEAHSCPGPITLPVTLKEPSASTDTPFTILGPENIVFVVAPSYDTSQMVMWESTNGGASFGPAYVGPANSVNLALKYTDVCSVASNLDDVLAFNAYGGQYDRSQGLSTLGSGGVSLLDFEMSSADPFATWSFDFYGSGCYVSSSNTVTPGKIPDQWFAFDDEGLIDAGIGTDQTTLGYDGGGTMECALSLPGDEVEAYTVDSEPETIQFFHYSAPKGPCGAEPGVNLSPGAISNWSGPTTVSHGAYPRLAGGKAGLFLLAGEGLSSASHGAPSSADIRQYDLASHNFGAPTQLTSVSNSGGLDPDSGGLGENFTSGELAAVWPDIGGETGLLSLFISTDGGAHFSAAQDIAQIGSGWAGFDNARVAVAANGTGFVTWENAGGLHVADLNALPAAYKRLVVHHHTTLELPVTCEAPTGTCTASASIKAKGHTIARGHRTVGSGDTEMLRLVLDATGQTLLAAAKGHLGATLALTITHPGSSPERLVLHTVLSA
jgi:hypothetical protein